MSASKSARLVQIDAILDHGAGDALALVAWNGNGSAPEND
jgi:hypothetical protein